MKKTNAREPQPSNSWHSTDLPTNHPFEDRFVRDLVALSTLPALWISAEPLRIAESLAAAVCATIQAEFVFVSLQGVGRERVNITHLARGRDPLEFDSAFGEKIRAWVAAQDPDDALEETIGGERFRVACRGIGLDAEFGVVAAAFQDDKSPTVFQRLLLNVAATQASVAIQTVRSEAGERKAREVAESLNTVAQSLGSDLDLQNVLQRATDFATQLTGAKFGAFFYNTINERGEAFVLYTLSGAPKEAFEKFGLPRNTRIFDPTFKGTRIVRSDDILKHADYGKNPPHHGMPKGHLPVRSYLAVPVKSRSGEVIGGLFFGHPEPGVFTEQSEKLAAGIAAQAAIALDNAKLYVAAQKELGERKQAEAALRESEARFASIFNQTTAGIAQSDPTGHFVLANERFCQLVGRTLDELLKLRIPDVTHPADQPENHRKFQALIDGSISSFQIEKRYVRPDGSSVWVHTDVSPIRDAAGNVTYTTGVATDISQRKRWEQLEAGQKQALELIARDAPISETLEVVIGMVEAESSTRLLASILLANSDGKRLSRGAAPNLPEDFRSLLDDHPIGPAAASCGTAAYRRAPVYVSSIKNSELWRDWADLAERNHLRACWSTPIFSNTGQLLGTFALYFSEEREPNDSDLRLVEVATRTVAVAIERQQSREALRETYEKVRQHASELEQFNRLMVGRELRMIDLKKEINSYCERLGESPRYPLTFDKTVSEGGA